MHRGVCTQLDCMASLLGQCTRVRFFLFLQALILKILRGKYPPLTGFSPGLSEVVKKCLTQVSRSSLCKHFHRTPLVSSIQITPSSRICQHSFWSPPGNLSIGDGPAQLILVKQNCTFTTQENTKTNLRQPTYSSFLQSPSKRPDTCKLLQEPVIREKVLSLGMALPQVSLAGPARPLSSKVGLCIRVSVPCWHSAQAREASIGFWHAQIFHQTWFERKVDCSSMASINNSSRSEGSIALSFKAMT